ncbi:hypothetical protein E2562_038533 [Oryza meyeriana var. granulata]|uniref:Uncharacterized protein n=1 Tax=Oryza meyeriana var. granulata TaxID=110450 RepID=A0A6G1BQ66_9ORYZ|nr:hypothetical protein E2562_038533 [Oryza meyeriana var. granulata]
MSMNSYSQSKLKKGLHTVELSDISIVDKCPNKSSGIPAYAKACTECDSVFPSCERVDRATQDRDIPSGSSVFPEDKELYSYSDISCS